jgi:hypothetical protein
MGAHVHTILTKLQQLRQVLRVKFTGNLLDDPQETCSHVC